VYSLAAQVTREHGTIMRALWMDFPADAQVRSIGDEYMFGAAFLVAPITSPMYHPSPEMTDPPPATKTRRVYLPAGTTWVDFWTGAAIPGGRSIDAPAPLDRLPLYVRAGSIVPMGPVLQHTDEKPADPIELRIYPGADGRFTLYEDDGVSDAYERGASADIEVRWDDRARTLAIGARTGAFPGMLASRQFRVVIVRADHGVGGGETAQVDRVVTYTGEKVTLTM
jgi:alpha-D-xyloside xylohydrolase